MVPFGLVQTGEDVRNELYTLQMEKGYQQHPEGLRHFRGHSSSGHLGCCAGLGVGREGNIWEHHQGR